MSEDRGRYHPVAFDELCERFMAEIRTNGKRLEQLESVISPLLARAHCECTDEEALTLIRNATRAAEEVSDHFKVTPESWQIWLDRQRETEQL